MFDLLELRKVRAAVCRLASQFEPGMVTGTDATRIMKEAAAVKNAAATLEAMAAARAAECNEWFGTGAASAAQWLAAQTGIGVGQANDALATGERLKTQPKVAEAASQGELSREQATAISDAAAADPDAEDRLLGEAKTKSLRELRDECDRTKAAAQPDDGAREKAVHDARSCRKRTTANGGAEITYQSTKSEVAEVWAVIQGFATKVFNAARKDGKRERPETYAADGLLAMARAANTGGSIKPVAGKILIRIDWDALLRGYPIGNEVSEIPGLGPLPVSAVRQMIESGDPFLAAVVTKGVDVHTVAHLGRKATAHQLSGIQWLDPHCTTLGCPRTEGLQIDHGTPWADRKITLLADLNHPCEHCHRLKTHHGWDYIPGTGKRPLVPPDDPRHPRNVSPARGDPSAA